MERGEDSISYPLLLLKPFILILHNFLDSTRNTF